MAESYVIDGYAFQNRKDFEQANKERETIAYLQAHADMSDRKAVYKIYKTASEKQSFQTVFGLKFMEELREILVDSEMVTEDVLDPIPVGRVLSPNAVPHGGDRDAEEYRKAYEKAKGGSLFKNLLIGVLLVVIVGMMIITYNNQYSVFTYFTNYKEEMREDLLNEYQEWEESLEEREEAVEKREKEWKDKSGGGQDSEK